jgi:hypothetical protein
VKERVMDVQVAAGLSQRELLAQRKYWRAEDGEVLERKTMETAHKLSLMAYLERNAERIEFTDACQYFGAPDGVDIEPIATRDPVEWVRSSPLYRALLEDVLYETTSCSRQLANLICRGEAAAARRQLARVANRGRDS